MRERTYPDMPLRGVMAILNSLNDRLLAWFI